MGRGGLQTPKAVAPGRGGSTKPVQGRNGSWDEDTQARSREAVSAQSVRKGEIGPLTAAGFWALPSPWWGMVVASAQAEAQETGQ